jgi:hypothetical protein
VSGRGLCDELITRPEESYRLKPAKYMLVRMNNPTTCVSLLYGKYNMNPTQYSPLPSKCPFKTQCVFCYNCLLFLFRLYTFIHIVFHFHVTSLLSVCSRCVHFCGFLIWNPFSLFN